MWWCAADTCNMRVSRKRLVLCVCTLVLVVLLYKMRFGAPSSPLPAGKMAGTGQKEADQAADDNHTDNKATDSVNDSDEALRFLLPDGGAAGLNDFPVDTDEVGMEDLGLGKGPLQEVKGPGMGGEIWVKPPPGVKKMDVQRNREVLQVKSAVDDLLNVAEKSSGKRNDIPNESTGPVMHVDALENVMMGLDIGGGG